jgi:hypothetical protein
LLSSKFPADVSIAPNGGFVFTAGLFRVAGGDIVAFRRAGLVLTIACALILYAGIAKFWHGIWPEETIGWLQRSSEAGFVLLGALLTHAWFLLTPSYNLVNLWSCSAWLGFLLGGTAALRSPATKPWLAGWPLGASGLCLAVSFFAKFPTGIALLVLSGLALWILSPRGKPRRIATALFGAGIGFGLLSFFCFGLKPAEWWARTNHGIQYLAIRQQTTTPHETTMLARLKQHILDIRDHVARPAIADFWVLDSVLLLSAAAFEMGHRFKAAVGRAESWVLATVLVVAAYLSYRHGFWSGTSTRDLPEFYFSWLVMIAVLLLLKTRRLLEARPWQWKDVLAVLAAGALLGCVPFVAALGTSNPLHLNIAMNLAGWFGLTLLLFRGLSQLDEGGYAVVVGTLALALFACSQIFTGILKTPFRLNTGILGQTEPTDVGTPPIRLKLDAETSRFVRSVRALASQNSFKPGGDVLAFFDMPGVVFAMGGRSPVLPWYPDGSAEARAGVQFALTMVGRERLNRAFVLQTDGSTEWLKGLHKVGIAFPEHYVLCGEVQDPVPYYLKEHVRLWRPLGTAPRTAGAPSSRTSAVQ